MFLDHVVSELLALLKSQVLGHCLVQHIATHIVECSLLTKSLFANGVYKIICLSIF
jgi:hypothetical protein